MTCIEYYKQLGVDISPLPKEERNIIASFFLEYIYFSNEELEEMIRIHAEKIKGQLNDEQDEIFENLQN